MPWKSFGALLDKNDTTWFAYVSSTFEWSFDGGLLVARGQSVRGGWC